MSTEVRETVAFAKALVPRYPLAEHPTLIDATHLVCALCRAVLMRDSRGIDTRDEDRLRALLERWINRAAEPASLGDLANRARDVRRELLARLHGQDAAVHQFVEGLFGTEVVADVDGERRRPCGLFVFAGPPGVGKTFMAELGASHLDRPIKRFDMSAYAHSHDAARLIGTPKGIVGAEPGVLTRFVQQNPNTVLLFDEIEKASPTAIHYFLQVLDAGRLEDKHTEQEVDFRDTIVIFTTNVGSSLYDNENTAGVHASNPTFHRNTILDALRAAVNPRTGEAFFPDAICSRLAAGYPILFRHLQIDDLARIARAELERVAALLERRTGQRYQVAEEIPLALVLREGGRTDARTIRANAEAFLKEEVFKACQLFAHERIDDAMRGIQRVTVEIDEAHAGELASAIFDNAGRPSVLVVGSPDLGARCQRHASKVTWHEAAGADRCFEILSRETVDFVLVDLGVGATTARAAGPVGAFPDVSVDRASDTTNLSFDSVPPAARRFARGQRLLEQLHRRAPELPIFLLSDGSDPTAGGIDEELLLACVRAGGARGAMHLVGEDAGQTGEAGGSRRLVTAIEQETMRLRRERIAVDLAAQAKAVSFDTAPALSGGELRIRCRNFKVAPVWRSGDAAHVVSEMERPTARFDDVIGAAGAKEALGALCEWLREPKKFAAAGVRPPKGVLLTGAPGTGKTLLARALAGEADCPFLVDAGSNFVTKYVGSGPEHVRTLFARARRYAPSIVFIDEIDAIGGRRDEARAGFSGHSEAMTLNQLLTEMDGFGTSTSRPVIVMAATNFPDKLDGALTRRFGRVIEVELPTTDERQHYLRTHLAARQQQTVSEAMIRRVAVQSAGTSIADLERVLAEASMLSLRHEGTVDDELLSEAFERITMGERNRATDLERTARHEAGHALVMCLTGAPPIYVTIVGRGRFGGYAAMDGSDEPGLLTKADLETRICQALGGREAELLYYGADEGESTGAASDLEQAARCARAMVDRYGMAEEIGPVSIAEQSTMAHGLAERRHAAVRRIIEEQQRRACTLLTRRKASLDRIAAALLDRNRLMQAELVALVPDSG